MVFWDEQMTQALPNRIKLGKVSILKGKVDKPLSQVSLRHFPKELEGD